MTQSKTYKSKIAAKFGILFSRIKNKFNGSKLVAETYTLKYNTTTKEYLVISVTMTEAEEKEFHIAIAEQQAKIMELMTSNEPGIPTNDRQAKAEKWAADVERNRQKQLAEKKKSAKKSLEMSEETAQEIVTELKRRGVYNGEPKAKKPTKPKTKKAPKVKNNTN
jgi:hypothetical protein